MNRSALCAQLMLPLIKVLEAPPPKPKVPINDDDIEEDKEEGEPEHVGNVSGHDTVSPAWLL